MSDSSPLLNISYSDGQPVGQSCVKYSDICEHCTCRPANIHFEVFAYPICPTLFLGRFPRRIRPVFRPYLPYARDCSRFTWFATARHPARIFLTPVVHRCITPPCEVRHVGTDGLGRLAGVRWLGVPWSTGHRHASWRSRPSGPTRAARGCRRQPPRGCGGPGDRRRRSGAGRNT